MIKNLGGKWKFRQATGTDPLAAARKKKDWLDARVPGCAHLDLMASGHIPDPLYGLGEIKVRWVEGEDWLYSHTFNCPPAMLKAERVELVCEGLDTFATVLLNGREVGRADNMFCTWRWDVARLLKSGRNRLLVHFQSSTRIGRELEREHGRLWATNGESFRSYVRKEQCATGWDWAPRLSGCGIWRPIRLEAWDGARIADLYAPVDWSDPRRPVIRLRVEVEALRAGRAELTAELAGDGKLKDAGLAARLQPGSNVLHADLPVERPRLWWPAGQGKQNLYGLRVSGTMDGRALEPRTLKIGLRRVELRRERDEEGESFVLRVNDRPVFCKGANWIPADSFPARVTRQRCEDLVRKAREANMNMLRVWGGGVYEADEFYDACDRLGIMVWQDFMFACAGYPDTLDPFLESVRREAEQNVRRLRNHPSVVLWCGRNEASSAPPGKIRPGQSPGEKIYDELLPEVCGRLDPARPYWPGSPCGGERPNDPRAGDQHAWGVWHDWQPAQWYRTFDGRFVSEFGMQAPPTLETIHLYVPAGQRHMQSRVMEHHNKAPLGAERLYRYLAGQFRVPGTFEDCVYLMQLVQGEVLKTAVEHWRARKFATAGTLFWQFNDCWPATSWSCIDSLHHPKALYYYAKRFFAPALAVISHRHGRLAVRLVNDRPEPLAATLVCGMADLDGYEAWTVDVSSEAPPNGVREVFAREGAELGLTDPTRQFVWCRLLDGEELISSNVRFFAPYKHVAWPSVEWETKVRKLGERSFQLTLESSAFAKGVWLRLEGMTASFEGNYFDALESVPVKVRLATEDDAEADAVARHLLIRTVGDVKQDE